MTPRRALWSHDLDELDTLDGSARIRRVWGLLMVCLALVWSIAFYVVGMHEAYVAAEQTAAHRLDHARTRPRVPAAAPKIEDRVEAVR